MSDTSQIPTTPGPDPSALPDDMTAVVPVQKIPSQTVQTYGGVAQTGPVDVHTETQMAITATQRMLAATEAEVVELDRQDQAISKRMDEIAAEYQRLGTQVTQVRAELAAKQQAALRLGDASAAFQDVLRAGTPAEQPSPAASAQ